MANAQASRTVEPDRAAPLCLAESDDVTRNELLGCFGSVEVRRIADVADLATIGKFWRSLNVHIFADMDCVVRGLRNSEAKPHVLILLKEGQPVALALGQEVHAPISWKLGYLDVPKGPVRFLEFPPNSLIGAHDEQTAAALISAIDTSLAERRLAFARFSQLDLCHPVSVALDGAEHRWRKDPVNETAMHWHLKLPETFDAFYQSRSKNVKNNIKTYKNRVRKAFGNAATLECLSRPEEVDRAADIAEQLTAKSYQRPLGIGFKDTLGQREWWRIAAERGWLRVYVLFLEGKPTAYWAGTVYAGAYTVNFTSFDPDYKRYHPGQVSLLLMIEEFCGDQEVQQIDYGYGEAAYKKRFGNVSQTEADIYYFTTSIRSQAWRVVRFIVSGGHRFLRTYLQRWNLLDKSRSFWRSLARRKGT